MKHASEHSLSLQAAQAGRPGVCGRHALRLAVAGALLTAAATAGAHHAPGHDDDHHHHHGHKQGHVHQHGLGTLDISQQGETLTVSFRSPLDSLIGFETEPANDQQRAQAKALLDQLQDAASVVQVPAAAQCTQQPPVINAPTLLDDDDEVDDHDDHDHDAGDHDDHDGGHDGDDHDHDHDHDADKGEHEHGHHADLAVTYTFTCKQPAAIDALKVTAFGNWPRLKHIDAAVVNDQGQQAQRLEAGKAVIRWKAS